MRARFRWRSPRAEDDSANHDADRSQTQGHARHRPGNPRDIENNYFDAVGRTQNYDQRSGPARLTIRRFVVLRLQARPRSVLLGPRCVQSLESKFQTLVIWPVLKVGSNANPALSSTVLFAGCDTLPTEGGT